MNWFKKSSSNTESKNGIEWVKLASIEQLNELLVSEEHTFVIFKHSTRCSISSMALSRFEREWDFDSETITPIYLDLIAHRDVSNFIAAHFNIEHQSPQVLLIKNSKCIHTATHNSIAVSAIKNVLNTTS